MRCRLEPSEKSPGGFDCDTEFESGTAMTLKEIDSLCHAADASDKSWWQLLTGGEPGLQVDEEYTNYMHKRGWKLAVETNGSIELKGDYNWISVSPKVAEHAIRQLKADEVRYVRGYGQAIPQTVVDARHKYISPAFCGNDLREETLEWCKDLVRNNPEWGLSMQMHKVWGVR